MVVKIFDDCACFESILTERNVQTVFQPIISLKNGEIYGYEALCRGPAQTKFVNPEVLFEFATEQQRLWELEFLCRTTALERYANLQLEGKLFLNVNPNIMSDIRFREGFTKDYLSQFSIDPDAIVFEITEKEAIRHIAHFQQTVDHYKNQQYRVAIDDVGSGYSGLNIITDVHPHFLKLDMHLIRNIDHDETKQSLVKSLVDFANLANIFIIAEGIETTAELLTLIKFGIHYGQGYLIQRPSPQKEPRNEEVYTIIIRENEQKSNLEPTQIISTSVEQITKATPTVQPTTVIKEVATIFKSLLVDGLCVEKDGKILGVVTKQRLYAALSGPFGYSLYSDKPVSEIMQTDFISVDRSTPINIVSKLAMMRTDDQLYDFITVTKKNDYYGTVTVKDLLEQTIQIEINFAKHLNPLSELPGNLMIEQQIQRNIEDDEGCTVLYIDLDNFKPYNDVYGFENGDDVITAVARILKKIASPLDFIGHIGGDDFIFMTTQDQAEQLGKAIIEKFDDIVPSFYREEDYETGHIQATNRHGEKETFPLLSISVAGVQTAHFNSLHKLAERASELKKVCKQQFGSYLLIER